MKVYILTYSNGLCGIFSDLLKLKELINTDFSKTKFLITQMDLNIYSDHSDHFNPEFKEIWLVLLRNSEFPIFASNSKDKTKEVYSLLSKFNLVEDICKLEINIISPLVINVLLELQKSDEQLSLEAPERNDMLQEFIKRFNMEEETVEKKTDVTYFDNDIIILDEEN